MASSTPMINKAYIDKLPHNHQLILVSYFITNSKALKTLERQWAQIQRDLPQKSYLGRNLSGSKHIDIGKLGGSIALLDPDNLNKGILGEVDCPVATGMFYHKEKEILFAGSNNWIRVISKGKITQKLGNNLFNDIHSLHLSSSGNLLVACTGVDSILEVDFNDTQKVIWSWIATEAGYTFSPNGGKRTIDRSINYQDMDISTPEHVTHLNSCIEYRPNKLLVTLFHQGELIEIDKQTGKVKVMLAEMKSPHNIRKCQDGFVVSDTRNGRVLILNSDFKVVKVFSKDYNWIQDCVELFSGSFFIGDSNNSRLVKVNHAGEKMASFNYGDLSRKMSSFLLIETDDAKNIFYE